MEAGCTLSGNSAYWSCDRCKGFFGDAEGKSPIEENSWVIGATGHNLTEHKATEVTCTEAGNSAYWSCDQCKGFFSDAEGKTSVEENSWVIGALGHNLEEYKAVETSCTSAGNSAYWSCDRCKGFFGDVEGKIAIAENSWVIAATDHDWEEWKIIKEASEDEEGLERRICKNNTGHIEERIIPKLSHVHKLNKIEAVDATCTGNGNIEYWVCTGCKKTFADDLGEKELNEEDLVVKATGHNLEAHAALEAGCTSAGNRAYWSCDRCKGFFGDAEGKIAIAENSWVIGATGHNLTEHTAVGATCTEAGNSAYWSCDQCKGYFSDAEGKTPIDENSWVIAATGHNMTEHKAVAATCTTAGNSAYWSCDQCKRFFSDSEGKTPIEENSWVIAVTGHNMTEHKAVDATCTEAGNSAYWSCDQCKGYFSDAEGKLLLEKNSWVIPTIDHKDVIIKGRVATCTANGMTDGKKCSVCGTILKKQEVIKATGHKEVTILGKAATETSSGLTNGKKCSVCGVITVPQKAIPKLETKAADGTVVGTGASAVIAEAAISTSPSDEGPTGTKFNLLQAQMKKVKKTSITIGWKGIPGAKYIVYGNKCGKGKKFEKIINVSGTSFTQNGLNKGTYYKYLVMAIKDGKVISTSKTLHIATSGGKVGNNTKVTLNKKKLILKAGKSKKLKATVKKGKLKVKKHRKVMWESSNPEVATATNSGKIKAISKGKAIIYAYAQNGKFAKCTVTVK